MPLGAFKAALMGTAGVSTGDVVLLSSQTASSSATITFTGITSTYGEYIFKFYNIHPSESEYFFIKFSTDGGSNYGLTKTTSTFRTRHKEDGTNGSLAYSTGDDLAQSTNKQDLTGGKFGIGNDESGIGELHLFNPASTTYVKHFISETHMTYETYSYNMHAAGYVNTTTAINAVQFGMNSGNMDTGKIKMWGVL